MISFMVANFVSRPAARHKTDDLPLQMTVFSTGIPVQMHFFTVLSFKCILESYFDYNITNNIGLVNFNPTRKELAHKFPV